MSPLDLVVILIIIVGGFVGYKEGFIVSLFSLGAIVLGILGGFKLMGTIMVMLGSNYKVDQTILPYVAFGIAFIAITIIVGLLGRTIKALLPAPMLGPVDHAVGSILGLVRAAFMLSIVLWIVDSLKIKIPEQWKADSWLQPMISDLMVRITNWI